jgi:hypothetical protein
MRLPRRRAIIFSSVISRMVHGIPQHPDHPIAVLVPELVEWRWTTIFCTISVRLPVARLSVPIVVHETIASGCTVKRRSTPAVQMRFSVKAGRGGQRSFRRRPDHAP